MLTYYLAILVAHQKSIKAKIKLTITYTSLKKEKGIRNHEQNAITTVVTDKA